LQLDCLAQVQAMDDLTALKKRTEAKTIFEEDEVITVTSYASAGIDQPAPKMH
jgi:hypothetical protein